MFDQSSLILELFSLNFRKTLSNHWVEMLCIGIGSISVLFGLSGLFLYKANDDVNSSLPIDTTVCQEVSEDITLDVNGAVVKPGTYTLKKGARVVDAIRSAGGFTHDSDADYIARSLNMAVIVEDGQKVFIPFIGQKNETTKEKYPIENNNQTTSKISINTADKDELMKLVGIGEKRAEDIIENRPYDVVQDLVDMDIVSEGVFKDIQPEIAL